MKLEDLKELWNKQVKVVLADNKVIIGCFCSFERAEDNSYGRANIDIETDEDVLYCVYLDEIKSITLK